MGSRPHNDCKKPEPHCNKWGFLLSKSGRQRNRPALLAGQRNELVRSVTSQPCRLARRATHKVRQLPVYQRVGHDIGRGDAFAGREAH